MTAAPTVAQISNLLYRRVPLGTGDESQGVGFGGAAGGLEIGAPALNLFARAL